MNPGVPIQKVCRSGRFRLLPGRFGRQTCLPRLEKFTKLRPSQKVVSGAALRQRQDTSRASVAALRNPEFRRTTLHRPYDDLNVVSQCKAGSASGAQRNTLGTHPPASPILWADRLPISSAAAREAAFSSAAPNAVLPKSILHPAWPSRSANAPIGPRMSPATSTDPAIHPNHPPAGSTRTGTPVQRTSSSAARHAAFTLEIRTSLAINQFCYFAGTRSHVRPATANRPSTPTPVERSSFPPSPAWTHRPPA